MCDTYNCEYCAEVEMEAIEENYRYIYCGGCGCSCCAGINCSDCNGCGCCASDSDSDSSEGNNPQPRTEIINGQEICWDCSCSIKAHSETYAWA